MIKKITLILAVASFIFTSCTSDIEVNAPSLQATMNGELFRPLDKKAILHDDGRLEITGNIGNKSISIFTYVGTKGTYKIAEKSTENGIEKISFNNEKNQFLLESGISSGEVTITDMYKDYVSGSFYFEDLISEDGTSINIQNGWFYMLPIELASDQIDEDINPCLANATLTAKANGTDIITTFHDATPFGVREPYPSIRIKASDQIQSIEIVFSVDALPGTYDLTGSGDYSATYTIDNTKSAATSGTLTILEHNKETKCLNGTFEYTTASGDVITEGVFSYGY